MMSLATKYRPHTFEECCGQISVIKILERQLELKEFKNCYLFCGPSGTGKTTIARIFANRINNGIGTPIEIDGASNNGVDNIRNIIDQAKERDLASEYKIFVIDECHMITTAGWNAFLKCIEEPPKYTIFIFCTTDPQKIPATILNRVMRFNLTRVKTELIKSRLEYVCQSENYTNYEESCDYISKLASGGVRDSLAMLEKCASYSTDLSINNVLASLGNFSYDVLFSLTNSIIDGDEASVIKIIDDCYNSGNDLSLFINQYTDFLLDLNKYCLFNTMSVVKIPSSLEVKLDSTGQLSPMCVKYTVGIENNVNYFNNLASEVLSLAVKLKSDTMPKTTTEIELIRLCRNN